MLSSTRIRKASFSLLLLGIATLLYVRHSQIEESRSLSWFDRSVVFVVSPVAGAVTSLREWISDTFKRYFFLVGVEKENAVLRAENLQLKIRDLVLSDLEKENERLTSALNLKKQMGGRGIAARVIGYPPSAPSRIVTINKGLNDGIRRRAPVVSADGLVGQVSRVFPDLSQVLLITDPTSSVDGRLATGARGLVVGKALKLGLKREFYISAFEYLSQSTEIGEGARVVTSGMDGVYPPGIPIGFVHSQKKKKYDIFQQAEVIPAVDFSKLSEVLVLP